MSRKHEEAKGETAHVFERVFLMTYRFEQTEEVEEVIDLLPDDVEGYLGPSFANASVGDIRVSIQEIEDDIEEFWDEEDMIGCGSGGHD